MKRWIWILAILVFVSGALAWVALMPRSAKLEASTPELLVISPVDKGCELKVLKDGAFQLWSRLEKCPLHTEEYIFDSEGQRLILLADGKYLAIDKKIGAKPVVLADAFNPPIGGENESKTWIDRITGRLSVVYTIPVGDVVENPEGDAYRAKFPMLKDTWFSAHKDQAPPEGEPSVAVVAQLDESAHNWKILAEEKTTCCADQAPGPAVVGDLIQERDGVISLQDLLLEPTCEAQGCDRAKVIDSVLHADWVKSAFAESDLAFMPLGSRDGFLFHLEVGDSVHAMSPPIFYCKDDCHEHEAITAAEGEISFAPKKDLILVTTEYQGTNAKLYHTGSPKPILELTPEAIAVWLPEKFQF